MSRPVIGITSYVEPASWAAWTDVPAALVPHGVRRHVHEAGGLAVVVPPLPDDATDDDARDGAVATRRADPRRRRRRRAVAVRRAAAPDDPCSHRGPTGTRPSCCWPQVTGLDDFPVLGVCRGMQVMAVAAGGELEQHLPDRLGHHGHSPCARDVRRAPGRAGAGQPAAQDPRRTASRCRRTTTRASRRRPATSRSGWSNDGVIEAFEDAGSRFRLAVQWHPEVGADPRLFEALVEACPCWPLTRSQSPRRDI